jgi:hypothetical protein
MEKQCFKCLSHKPLSDFYKHSAMGDGHLNKCKECTKSDTNKHRQDNLERIRSYDKMRASMPHRIALRREVAKQYASQFPDRKKANTAVSNAVRDGKLKKQPCWVCGEKAIAHHPDYSRPLDVVWLCQPHHKQTHALV